MTSRNPQSTQKRSVEKATQLAGVGYGFVTDNDPEDAKANVVLVQPRGRSASIPMSIGVNEIGDIHVPPEEGAPVAFVRQSDGAPLIFASFYASVEDVPDYEVGARRIGHSDSGANVTINPDGEITVESDGGTTVTLKNDGTLVLNNGNEGVITDIETTSSDGYVTSVTHVRNSNILV